MKHHTRKSIVAVILGFVAVVILSVVTDMLVEALHIFPSQSHPELYAWWMLLIALIYRTLFTVGGGYVTARLAPRRPIKHAVILGAIGMVVATIGAMANWDKSVGAEWYPLLLIVLSIPATWLGGKIQTRKHF